MSYVIYITTDNKNKSGYNIATDGKYKVNYNSNKIENARTSIATDSKSEGSHNLTCYSNV